MHGAGNRPIPPIERFLDKVRKVESGCWEWTGSRSVGYGRLHIAGKSELAHRFAYEHYIGPIPEGLVIDHLCRVRHCVNPAHMEVVTQTENKLRGTGSPAVNAKKTHCKRGHPLTPENTYVHPRKGYRVCRQCTREAQLRMVNADRDGYRAKQRSLAKRRRESLR